MSKVSEEIRRLQTEIPSDVKLVAVSKFHPAELIKEAYDAGQRLFGESRVQELLAKIPLLPDDIRWHFIGHLQTNKVKQLIGRTALIESVDSERLLSLINNESERAGVKTDVLLQIHVAKEETKFGFYPEEFIAFMQTDPAQKYKFVKIRGLMGMASNTDDVERVKEDFQSLHSLFEKYKDNSSGFDILSMGMSGDWRVAIREGSTMVRIGSQIFGERDY